MPKRESKDIEGRVPLVLSVTREEKALLEEEAGRARQTVSAFVLRGVMALISAPRFGDVPMLPSSGFCVLPTGVDEHIFVPRNWGPEDLRRAAKFYEGLEETKGEGV